MYTTVLIRTARKEGRKESKNNYKASRLMTKNRRRPTAVQRLFSRMNNVFVSSFSSMELHSLQYGIIIRSLVRYFRGIWRFIHHSFSPSFSPSFLPSYLPSFLPSTILIFYPSTTPLLPSFLPSSYYHPL